MGKRRVVIVLFIVALMFTGCAGFGMPFFREKTNAKITIAIMQDPYVENFNTNFYTGWLEEKTGYDIEFVYFRKGYEKEYLEAMLEKDQGVVDAVFLAENNDILSKEEFQTLCDRGLICELTGLSEQDSNIMKMKESLGATDQIFYMPRIKNGKKEINERILWINKNWLEKLGLTIPKTYEELEEVLYAFKTKDPNGNGIHDEIPLLTNNSKTAFDCRDFFMSAFFEEVDQGKDYCDRLMDKGLLSKECEKFSKKQLREMINSPLDYVGAFTSQSISDLLYPFCAEVFTRYTFVAPLINKNGQAHASTIIANDSIGGYIPENAVHKKEAFEIMDLMLSEEASVISVYGEKNVDYRDAVEGELSAYGEKAVITIINYLKSGVQNKNFSEAGPLNLPSLYEDAVKWGGNNSYAEYMDARAVRIYEKYYK